MSDETICLTDLMSTVAAILDLELPQGAGPDSGIVLSALFGQERNKPIREALVYHSFLSTFAIRQGHWKPILDTEGSGDSSCRAMKIPRPDLQGQLRLPYMLASSLQIGNVAGVVKGWGDRGVALKIDGEQMPRGKDLRLGHAHDLNGSELVVWIRRESIEPVRI